MFVNNAGMSPLYDRLDAVTEELYDKTLAVNLKGPFRLGVLAGDDRSHRPQPRRALVEPARAGQRNRAPLGRPVVTRRLQERSHRLAQSRGGQRSLDPPTRDRGPR